MSASSTPNGRRRRRGAAHHGAVVTTAGDQSPFVGELRTANEYPTAETIDTLYEQLDFQRACQAFLRNITASSMYSFREGLRRHLGADTAQHYVIWDGSFDARSLLLTPNSETVYGLGFLALEVDGPTGVEVPPGVLGVFNDSTVVAGTTAVFTTLWKTNGEIRCMRAERDEQHYSHRQANDHNLLNAAVDERRRRGVRPLVVADRRALAGVVDSAAGEPFAGAAARYGG